MQGKFDEALGNAETAIAALGNSAAGQVRSADPERGPSHRDGTHTRRYYIYIHTCIYIYTYMYSMYNNVYHYI